MDIDLILEPDLTPGQIKEIGVLAERYPFRTLWIQNYARARDAFLCAVPVAEATRRLRIGIVVVSPYEMHPLKMANSLLTLNEYSQGRSQLVVGGGGEWVGVMGMTYGRRVKGVEESIDILKQAVTGKLVNYKGEVYHARGYLAPWAKDAPPLIYGGASGPQMLRASAKAADGIMMSDIALEMLDEPLRRVREALATRQRDPADFRISNFLAWHVKDDREASLREARRELIIRGWLEKEWLEPFLEPAEVEVVAEHKDAFLKAFRNRSGVIDDVPPDIVDRLVDGLSCSGDRSDLDRHIERLRQYADRGMTETALRIHDDPADSIRMLGEEVLPALR